MLPRKTAAAKASGNVASTAAARLAGTLGTGSAPTAEQPDSEKPVSELVQKATVALRDANSAAQRALRIVEDTKDVKNNMLAELHQQNTQLEKMDKKLIQLKENVSYSEKILRYMRMCCCCWMFDSCTGLDPEDRRERDWQRDVKSGKTAKGAALYSRPGPQANISAAPGPGRAGSSGKDASPQPQFQNLDVSLPRGHERAGMKLAKEARKHDEIIGQIDTGLDDILNGAKAINSELSQQDPLVDHVVSGVETAHDRIVHMNNKSQLRKY